MRSRYTQSNTSIRLITISQILSEKEKELLAHLENGNTIMEAGEIMEISCHTADFHSRNIKKKLGAKTITAAVAMTIRNGYL